MTKHRRSTGAPVAAHRWLRAAVAVCGLALAGTGLLPGTTAGPARADGVSDGSDWGAQGLLSSNSAVTVHWDNAGNPAADVVPRDGRQSIPHSGGLSYDDIAPATAAAYAADFGGGNGLGGLAVQVSQSSGLTNQAVAVTIKGARQGAAYAGQSSTDYFQVFQCWGGLTANGAPDPNAANPDPQTCQVGAIGSDTRGGLAQHAETRYVRGDPLAAGGDWKSYHDAGAGDPDPFVPFTAINGTVADGNASGAQNQFFNTATTNELSAISVGPTGSATRSFEIQTTDESPGLGCGVRDSVPSSSHCWLVIVPRIDSASGLPDAGPIAPSVWAQRLQVRLTFNDIGAGCPSGQSRSLFTGSELMVAGAASWTPGLCAAKNIAVGYTRLGDAVARNQFATGGTPAILTTTPPSRSADAAPVGLAAPVIAYQLTYNVACAGRQDAVTTDAAAQTCGYADLAAARAEFVKSGTLYRGLRLDARLIVKLLTQSYSDAIIQDASMPLPPWAKGSRPRSLLYDPEFQRLNPGLGHLDPSTFTGGSSMMDHLIVELTRSDAAAQIWRWALADPDAHAFLEGCPDTDGMVINPFYSTRTYDACQGQATTLGQQATAAIAASTVATTYVDQAPSYPPDGSPFPLPSWQELRIPGEPTKTVVDQVPPVDNLVVAGRDVGIGHTPRNVWCRNDPSFSNPACGNPPGKYSDPGGRDDPSRLIDIGLTDAATAARWRVPTAQLCDSSGAHCVGADTGSLQKAATEFTPDGSGWLEPGPADLAGGAYPLTVPVYAAVDPNLPLDQRTAYADAIDYMTTTGQTPGFDPGDLPPGYAPITPAMRAQAVSAIAQLRTAAPTAPPSPSPAQGHHKPHASPSGGTSSAPAPAPVTAHLPTATAPSVVVPTVAAGPADVTADPMVTVSSMSEPGPSYLVPLGLSIAVLAGFAGPLMRLWGRVRVTR